MFLDYNVKKYTIKASSSIGGIVRHLESSSEKVVFCMSSNKLLGVITNGDILRWLAKGRKVDLDTPSEVIQNKKFYYLPIHSTYDVKKKMLEKFGLYPYPR